MIREMNKLLVEHHEDYRLFGIILFTDAHPQVTRMLQDPLYYAALDEISGERILVFATMLFRARQRYPEPPPGVFGNVAPIWEEPNANKELLSWFDIRGRDQLPALVLFGSNGDTLSYHHDKLGGRTAGEVFESLEKAFSVVASEIGDRALDQHVLQELFRRLRWKRRKETTRRQLRRILKTISLFRGAVGP